MKKQFFSFLFIAFTCTFATFMECKAGFVIKRTGKNGGILTHAQTDISPTFTVSPGVAFPAVYEFSAKGYSKGSGALAYISAGCGILGLAIGSPQTAAVMILLGLAAGVFGSAGLKRSKHNKFHKALCYIGIILGAILIVLGSIPILFLI